MRHPAEGITRTRRGTFGSLPDWGSPLGRTSQDLLIQCSSIPTKAETAASTSRSERGRTADHSGVGLRPKCVSGGAKLCRPCILPAEPVIHFFADVLWGKAVTRFFEPLAPAIRPRFHGASRVPQ